MLARTAFLALAFVALTGCNRAYQQKMKLGESALRAGKPAIALREFGEACALVEDSEACDKKRAIAQAAQNQLLPEAESLLATGHYTECLAKLVDLRKFAASPHTQEVAEAAMDGLAQQCRESKGDGWLGALYFARCLAQATPIAMSPKWNALEASARAQGATLLSSVAANAGTPGSAWAYTSLAHCYDSGTVQQATVEGAYARFVNTMRVQATVTVNDSAAPQLCASLQRTFDDRLGCDTSRASLRVNLGLTQSSVQHTFTDVPYTKRYVERVEQYENAEWVRLNNTVERRRERVVQYEREMAVLRADCEQSNIQRACARHNALVPGYNQEVAEVNRLSRVLSQTPQLLENKIYADYRYIERTHRWELPYGASAQVGAFSVPKQGVLSFTGVEQQGLDAADVPDKVATPPTTQQFQGELQQVLLALAEEALNAEFRQRAQSVPPAGIAPGTPLDAWLWAQHLGGEDADQAFRAQVEQALRARPAYAQPLSCR